MVNVISLREVVEAMEGLSDECVSYLALGLSGNHHGNG